MFRSLKKITLALSCALGCLLTHTLHASEQGPDYREQVLNLDTTVGDKNASYRVTEFFSYTCPACHAANDDKELNKAKQILIDNSIASMRYSDLPLYKADAILGISHRCFVLSHMDWYIDDFSIAQIFNDSKKQFMKTVHDENALNTVLNNIVFNHAQIRNHYDDCTSSLLSDLNKINSFANIYWDSQHSRAKKSEINTRTPSFIIEKNAVLRENTTRSHRHLQMLKYSMHLITLIHTGEFLEKGFDDPCQKNWFLRALKYLKWF